VVSKRGKKEGGVKRERVKEGGQISREASRKNFEFILRVRDKTDVLL